MAKILKDRTNQTIMDAIRSDMPLSYQARIPAATQAGVKNTAEQLFNYRPMLNEFVDALVNQIGSVIGQGMVWNNPLAAFKQGMLSFGSTVEEYQVGLLNAHTYDPDRDYMERDIFGQEQPDVKSIFHTVNRQNYYKVTINDAMLRRAFLDDGGLSSFVTDLMAAPTTSDSLDEFKLMCRLIPQYEEMGGFFKVQVADVASLSSTEAEAKAALRRMRAIAGNMRFPSRMYNAAGMPTFANPEDLILITTPEFQSGIDVNALAAAFHVDYANFDTRTVQIPQSEFGISGAQAILTTKNFFRVYDTRIENTSMPNPAGLYNNYFFHHHGIISCSTFVPAVLFTTGTGTTIPSTAIVPPTALTITVDKDANGNPVTAFKAGGIYGVSVSGTPAGSDYSTVWSVSGNTSTKTFITQDGNVHIGSDEKATSITIKCVAVFVNGVSKTQAQTVTPGVIVWPISA